MPTIYNPGDVSVPVLRWTVLPKGTKAVNRVTGAVASELPRSVAESRQVQELVKAGVLSVVTPTVSTPVPVEAPVVVEAPRLAEEGTSAEIVAEEPTKQFSWKRHKGD